jgi:hypothetical protein
VTRPVTVLGVRAEVLAYVAEHLDYLDTVAERTNTPRVAQERMPKARLEHLEGLVRIARDSVVRDERSVPSPHYLRALAAQACAWLEELRERGDVSW